MGSSLGPVLANVLMTEFEKVVIQKLIDDGTIPFYIRYVDDTLALIKPENIDRVLKMFNEFAKGITFTVDTFEDGNIHFLDLFINGSNLETSIYSKPTNTGQYINFGSFTPWRLKIAWITALYERGKRLCSTNALFQKHLENLKQKMSWNGFPRHIRISILKRLANKTPRKKPTSDEDVTTIWIHLPYMGNHGELLTKKLVRKLIRCSKSNVHFRTTYDTKKISSYCTTKDKTPKDQTSGVIYQIECPGCGDKYIGKSERCFGTRMHCQGTRENEPMYRHLYKCERFRESCEMFAINDIGRYDYQVHNYILHAVLNNSKIIKRLRNSFQLEFLEAYYIKHNNPKINVGIAASKELVLFK